MVETPDFEQIARRMFPVDNMGHDAIAAELSAESRAHVVEQLRLVWNARGAADQETIAPAIEYLNVLAKAKEPPDVLAQIRTLDRDGVSQINSGATEQDPGLD